MNIIDHPITGVDDRNPKMVCNEGINKETTTLVKSGSPVTSPKQVASNSAEAQHIEKTRRRVERNPFDFSKVSTVGKNLEGARSMENLIEQKMMERMQIKKEKRSKTPLLVASKLDTSPSVEIQDSSMSEASMQDDSSGRTSLAGIRERKPIRRTVSSCSSQRREQTHASNLGYEDVCELPLTTGKPKRVNRSRSMGLGASTPNETNDTMEDDGNRRVSLAAVRERRPVRRTRSSCSGDQPEQTQCPNLGYQDVSKASLGYEDVCDIPATTGKPKRANRSRSMGLGTSTSKDTNETKDDSNRRVSLAVIKERKPIKKSTSSSKRLEQTQCKPQVTTMKPKKIKKSRSTDDMVFEFSRTSTSASAEKMSKPQVTTSKPKKISRSRSIDDIVLESSRPVPVAEEIVDGKPSDGDTTTSYIQKLAGGKRRSSILRMVGTLLDSIVPDSTESTSEIGSASLGKLPEPKLGRSRSSGTPLGKLPEPKLGRSRSTGTHSDDTVSIDASEATGTSYSIATSDSDPLQQKKKKKKVVRKRSNDTSESSPNPSSRQNQEKKRGGRLRSSTGTSSGLASTGTSHSVPSGLENVSSGPRRQRIKRSESMGMQKRSVRDLSRENSQKGLPTSYQPSAINGPRADPDPPSAAARLDSLCSGPGLGRQRMKRSVSMGYQQRSGGEKATASAPSTGFRQRAERSTRPKTGQADTSTLASTPNVSSSSELDSLSNGPSRQRVKQSDSTGRRNRGSLSPRNSQRVLTAAGADAESASGPSKRQRAQRSTSMGLGAGSVGSSGNLATLEEGRSCKSKGGRTKKTSRSPRRATSPTRVLATQVEDFAVGCAYEDCSETPNNDIESRRQTSPARVRVENDDLEDLDASLMDASLDCSKASLSISERLAATLSTIGRRSRGKDDLQEEEEDMDASMSLSERLSAKLSNIGRRARGSMKKIDQAMHQQDSTTGDNHLNATWDSPRASGNEKHSVSPVNLARSTSLDEAGGSTGLQATAGTRAGSRRGGNSLRRSAASFDATNKAGGRAGGHSLRRSVVSFDTTNEAGPNEDTVSTAGALGRSTSVNEIGGMSRTTSSRDVGVMNRTASSRDVGGMSRTASSRDVGAMKRATSSRDVGGLKKTGSSRKINLSQSVAATTIALSVTGGSGTSTASGQAKRRQSRLIRTPSLIELAGGAVTRAPGAAGPGKSLRSSKTKPPSQRNLLQGQPVPQAA